MIFDGELYDRTVDFARRFHRMAHGHLTTRRQAKLWREAEGYFKLLKGDEIEEWDDEPLMLFQETFTEYWIEDDSGGHFYDCLACICRSAINTFTEGCGVLGYTVGDLREMYDGQVPDWIAATYNDPAALVAAPDAAGLWF